MDRLTVAVDVGPLHGHRTGVGTAVAHLVDALDDRDDLEVRPFLTSFRSRPRPGETRLPVPAAFALRWWSRSDLPRADRWLAADVVHGTNYTAPPSRAPTVISVYDCWFLRHPERATPAVRRAAAVLRRRVRRGAHVHVSSTASADEARELLDTDRVHAIHLGPPDPPVTTPDGAPPPHRIVAELDRHPYVLALGTVERRKAIADLVEAFGHLARRRDGELRLVIAGAPGDADGEVRARVAALPDDVRGRVHVVGAVDRATRDRLLTRARVLAYPSLDEGFGFPILEAQQVGVPVIGRRAGSIPEVGGAGVALVDDGDDFGERLAERLGDVLDDPDLRHRLIDGGTRNLERFSWHRTAADLVELYHRTLTSTGGTS